MKHVFKALLPSLLLLALTGCIYDPGMYRQDGYYGDDYRGAPVQVRVDYSADRDRSYRQPAQSCYHRDGSRDNYHRRCLNDSRNYQGRRYGR